MRLDRILAFAVDGVALDTETHLIAPGLLAPPMVCGSVACLTEDGIAGELLPRQEVLELLQRLLQDPDKIIAGANIAFDLLVMAQECARQRIDIIPDIFAAFEQERIYDLQIAEALHAIACGHLNNDPRTDRPLVNPETKKRARYSLAMCVDLVLGRTDAKANDEWRLRYAELQDVPIDNWPETARIYPIDDAKNTLECSLAQCGHLPKTTPIHNWGPNGCFDCGVTRFGEMCISKRRHRNLHDLAHQVKAAFALHLGAAWGFHVDQAKVDVVERYALAKRANGITPFREAGVIRPLGSVNQAVLKKLVAKAYGSTEPCSVCNGLGKIPAKIPKKIRCPTCRGRSTLWKCGGKMFAPTYPGTCKECSNEGKILNVRGFVCCYGPNDEKTCDGTGLRLSNAVPRSDTGCVSTSADTLHESGDEFVMSYGDFTEDSKWLKDYIPYLRLGRQKQDDGSWRDIPLTLKPRVLLKSGRVSYGDHIGTFPRWLGFVDRETNRYIPSFRECIVARGLRYQEVVVADDYILQEGETRCESVAP